MRVQRRFQHRGQSMLIFALTATVLFGLIGLAVDAGVGYFNSSLLERASSASSLAGVTYMPDGWSTTVNPEVQAIATKNGMKDGAGGAFSSAPCPNNGQICVRTCEVDGNQPPVAFPPCGSSTATLPAANQLAVEICEPVANSFVRLLGFSATHQECRTSIAEYLRPITLGQPGNQLGGDLSPNGLGGANYKYFVRTEGYGTDRAQGDAYTPRLDDLAAGSGNGCGANPGHAYAADGSNNCFSQFNSTLPDIHFLSGVNGTESTGAPPPTALPANGGYSYQVFVPAGQTGDLQVFNPIFGPDSAGGGACPGAQVSAVAGVNSNYNLHECDSLAGHVNGDGAANANQKQYSTMGYTVYQVNNVFDHRTDVIQSQMLVDPIDAVGWGANTWIEVRNNKTHAGGLPNLFHQWQSVCAYTPVGVPGTSGTETASLVQQSGSCSLSGGVKGAYYRLRIDTLDYLGKDPSSVGDPNSLAHKGLSLRVAGCASCSVGGLNEMSIFTPLVAGGAGTQFPISLMAVPPEYRGQTLTVDVYDPGDISCTGVPCSNLLTILDASLPAPQPAKLGVSPSSGLGVAWLGPARGLAENPISNVDCPQPPPAAVIETQCVGGDVPQNTPSRNLYNGTWIRYYVAVDPGYNPGCTYAYDPANPCANNASSQYWYWSLQYGLTNATGTDTITFGVGYAGSPVHLVTG